MVYIWYHKAYGTLLLLSFTISICDKGVPSVSPVERGSITLRVKPKSYAHGTRNLPRKDSQGHYSPEYVAPASSRFGQLADDVTTIFPVGKKLSTMYFKQATFPHQILSPMSAVDKLANTVTFAHEWKRNSESGDLGTTASLTLTRYTVFTTWIYLTQASSSTPVTAKTRVILLSIEFWEIIPAEFRRYRKTPVLTCPCSPTRKQGSGRRELEWRPQWKGRCLMIQGVYFATVPSMER